MSKPRTLSDIACAQKYRAKTAQLEAEVHSRLCRELEEELSRFSLAGLDLEEGQRARIEETY